MPDLSHLDNKYFIHESIYNCPFCNRRHVAYVISGKFVFDWTDSKKCYGYLAKCSSCQGASMHLSFNEISTYSPQHTSYYRFHPDVLKDGDLDDKFFYSVPTSFFVMDSNVPTVLRELMTEAEGCLKSNFLTGASACARKAIYELARLLGGTGANYEERIKSIKDLRKEVDAEYFDTLLTIQQVTSSKVHEDSYDGWQSKHLRLILSTLKEILDAIYVIPELKKRKREGILKLKDNLVGSPKKEEKK